MTEAERALDASLSNASLPKTVIRDGIPVDRAEEARKVGNYLAALFNQADDVVCALRELLEKMLPLKGGAVADFVMRESFTKMAKLRGRRSELLNELAHLLRDDEPPAAAPVPSR